MTFILSYFRSGNVLAIARIGMKISPCRGGYDSFSGRTSNSTLRQLWNSKCSAEGRVVSCCKLTRSMCSGKDLGIEGAPADSFGDLERGYVKKSSTFDDLTRLRTLTKEAMQYRARSFSSSNEKRIKKICTLYKSLSAEHRNIFLQELAENHEVNHKQIYQTAKSLSEVENDSSLKIKKIEDQLRSLLTPEYSWLFLQIGKLEGGVKFLVDLRTDVLDLIAEKNSSVAEILHLNVTLRELLSVWFSVGFLELERVTWKSPCELLQKISEYEAVHPMRSWTDLKRRVGPYRRCFVFLHRSMPGEPIVVLHTALSDEISDSIKGIVSARSRMSAGATEAKEISNDWLEDSEKIKAAVFYSITSTQKGLQGIELGNYLIKQVVRELQNEFPQMNQFSSLSPIPSFRAWLLDKLRTAEKGENDILSEREIGRLADHLGSGDVVRQLKRLIFTNRWIEDDALSTLLEVPLMRNCARYLYLEKRRGYALDSVANFHLKNGAVMWRLNWKADLTPRGLSNSLGIMVNYRYILSETEENSRNYIDKQSISCCEKIIRLSDEAGQLMTIPSKL